MPALVKPKTLGDVIVPVGDNRYSWDWVVLAAGQVYEIGSVLGKVTATGKHQLSPASGSDGSEIASAILMERVDASDQDRMAAAIIRGPVGVKDAGCVFHASVSTDAAIRTKMSQLGQVTGFGIAERPTVIGTLGLEELASVTVSSAFIGETMTVTLFLPDGWSLVSISATFAGAGVALSGSGSESPIIRTYVPAAAGALAVSAEVLNKDGEAVSVSASGTASVAPPVSITAPSVAGTLAVGDTLSATEGSWTGSPTITLQWLRNGSEIAGATGLTYVLASSDVGSMISVRATASNAGGSFSVTSPAIGPVIATPVYDFNADIVLLMFGQSNEQGQNGGGGQAPIDATLDQDSSGRIRRWDATNGTDVLATQPLAGWPAYSQMAPTRGFRMAQELLARQHPSKKIVLVNCAVAGAKLTGSTLGVGGSYYNTTISRMTACLAAFPEAEVFMSWTQGEADANDSVTAANYTTAFTNMLNGIRAVAGASGMRAIIHQMVPERFYGEVEDLPYRQVIDRVHKLIPLTIPNAIFIGASMGTQIAADPSHFTSPGHRNAGTRAAAWVSRIAMWQTTVPAVPAAPVVVTADTIRISVTDPQPPAYVIEYRAAGSTEAWTEQIVFPKVWVDAPGTFDVTVEGTGDREVRLKARSYAGTSGTSASVTVASPTGDAPTVVTAPVISGSTTFGSVLTATAGSYTGSPTITRQWLRNGVAISGATAITYTLVAADVGAPITVQETAANSGGSVISTSAAVGPIAAAVPSAFASSGFSLATGDAPNEIKVTISALPANNGAAITNLQYRYTGLAADTWLDLGGATIGTYVITVPLPATSYNVVPRALNAAGAGPAGTAKAVTSGAAAEPDDIVFGAGQITVNALATVAAPAVTFGAGQITITA